MFWHEQVSTPPRQLSGAVRTGSTSFAYGAAGGLDRHHLFSMARTTLARTSSPLHASTLNYDDVGVDYHIEFGR